MKNRTKSKRKSAREEAISIFRKNGGLLRTMEAVRYGVHPRTLYAMRDAGVLERLGRGVYRLSDLPPLSDPDLVTVALSVPDGVVCLISAMAFHEITTQIPHEVYISLRRGAEPPRLKHPPIRFFWFTGSAFTEGIETHEVDGIKVRVYNAAKTVADSFKYRNKLGLDTALEALKFFLRDRKGSPDELMRFARVCHVDKVIRPYIEALL
jgi:predicted transcriptional regulator of viral defense system